MANSSLMNAIKTNLSTAHNIPNSYGAAIAYFRKQKGISQEELASMVSFSLETLGRLERNESEAPNMSHIIEICICLKLKHSIASKLFNLCGYSSYLDNLNSDQAIAYSTILDEGGKFSVEEVNECLIELNLSPISKKL